MRRSSAQGRGSCGAGAMLVGELAPRLGTAFGEISGPGAPEARFAYRPAAGVSAEGKRGARSRAGSSMHWSSGSRATGSGASPPPALTWTSSPRARRPRRARLCEPGPAAGPRARPQDCRDREPAPALGPPAPPPARRRLVGARSDEEPVSARLSGRLPAQAFLTSTDRRLIEPAAGPDTAFYKVEGGAVTALLS